MYLNFIAIHVCMGHFLILDLILLLMVAFITLLERKWMALLQRRFGPTVVGIYGLFQALADGLKLFLKEMIFPLNANVGLFFIGPIWTFFCALSNWIIIPIYSILTLSNLNYSVLYIYLISGLSVYGIILSGWASNSQYSILGALRSIAQLISYELLLGFIFLILSLFSNSLNFINFIWHQIKRIYIYSLIPICILFLIVMLAETNRHPFDLPEAEGELVAGYNTEYSSIKFSFFFLGEYLNIIFSVLLILILFFGGWRFNTFSFIIFSSIILLFISFFILCRIFLPRYRYDQLMNIGWKTLLPVLFGFLILYSTILKNFNIMYFTTENLGYFKAY